ncbi:MAG: hypothetical protein LUO80_06945 [Methylococcaceae bacterium]|nr:hypothetical protein [Methylococcaceae bacterium]
MHFIRSTALILSTIGLVCAGSATAADHDINRLSNGGFEVVWPNQHCIATFNAKGQAMSYSDGCNDPLIARSQTIASQNVKGSGARKGGKASHGKQTSLEYKRGYNDALKGNAFDQDRHPQDYKDGFRAGENAR